MDPREYFAAERTLLAWLRTGLALMGFGFVVSRFGLFLQSLTMLHDLPADGRGGLSIWFGAAMIVMGVVILILASWQHVATVKQLREGVELTVKQFSLGVALCLTLALLGTLMVFYLVMA